MPTSIEKKAIRAIPPTGTVGQANQCAGSRSMGNRSASLSDCWDKKGAAVFSDAVFAIANLKAKAENV
jgi:hypothetical protein